MADQDCVEWLNEGHKTWNDRRSMVEFKPDLTGLDFRELIPATATERQRGFFKKFNFRNTNLRGANLSGLDFSNANFNNADLSETNLQNGIFVNAKFRDACLINSNAAHADFSNAGFKGANFKGANFRGAKFSDTILSNETISEYQIESAELRAIDSDARFSDRFASTGLGAGGIDSGKTPPVSDESQRGRYLVLYGTNRKAILENGATVDFGSERDSKLNLGTCQVYIPKSHKVGSIGSPFWKRLIKGDDRIKIRKLVTLNGGLYWKVVREQFSTDDQSCPPTLFIHGYNTKFKDAVKTAAQFGFDLGLNTGISLFSWPSRGSKRNYSADEATVEASRDYLVEFISGYLSSSKIGKLNIIAHSMGCRCLIAAIEKMALTTPDELKKINQICFAAADVDQDLMRGMGAHLVKNSGRTTVYACPRDRALGISSWLHSFDRVGLLPPVFLLDQIDTVEVEKTDLIGLGHGYVAGARSVLNDIFQLIGHSTPPEKRFSIQASSNSSVSHWRLKE